MKYFLLIAGLFSMNQNVEAQTGRSTHKFICFAQKEYAPTISIELDHHYSDANSASAKGTRYANIFIERHLMDLWTNKKWRAKDILLKINASYGSTAENLNRLIHYELGSGESLSFEAYDRSESSNELIQSASINIQDGKVKSMNINGTDYGFLERCIETEASSSTTTP